LQRLRDFVARGYSRTIRLQEAAAVAGLERTYFSAFFHRRTGVRFSVWLRQQRVERAKDLLLTGHHDLAAVARAVGFGDARTFQRAFKRVTGATPSAFRSGAMSSSGR
jgi:AraC-like DNA-binding protein